MGSWVHEACVTDELPRTKVAGMPRFDGKDLPSTGCVPHLSASHARRTYVDQVVFDSGEYEQNVPVFMEWRR